MTAKKNQLLSFVALLILSSSVLGQTKLTTAQNYIKGLQTSNPKFAYTKGSFNVTDNGALNYEIPIVAVAGTAGMTPKITLQYNSNSGSGIMGEGWSITGLSVITRTSQNIAIDGESGKINFNDDDRLILDGQRLINVDITKPYWANSSEREYRTELNTFKQIKAFFVGTEVKRFEVKTKDGLIYYYGAVSNIDANPVYLRETTQNKIMTWVLVRIEDRNGNQIDYEYDKAALLKNFIQPRFINYTGFKNQPNSKFALIQFNYDKSDYANNAFLEGILKQTPNAKYINGQKIIYDEYLTSIVCKFDDGTNLTPVKNKIRTYKIHYIRGKNDNRKVFVDFIEECINDDDCLKTDFSWLTENEMFQFSPTNIVSQNTNETLEENYQIFTGDFNGDGLIDNCAVKIDADKLQFVFTTNEKGRFKTISKYSINAKVDRRCRILTNDFDANGTTDFSFNWVEGNKWHFVTSYTKLNFTDNTIKEPTLGAIYEKQIDPNIKWNEIFYSLADLDADALQDLFCYYYLGNKIIFYTAKNNADKSFSITKAPPFQTTLGTNDTIPNNTPINLGDYNSDGINDFLFTWTDGKAWHSVTSILNKGLTTASPVVVGSGGISLSKDSISYSVITLGKGKIDSLDIDSIVGVKTTSNQIFPNINFPATKSVYVLDVNHDGNSDLLISFMDKTGWKVWVAIGKGNGAFETPIPSNIDNDNYPYLFTQSFGDFNGDGVIDICNTHSNDQGWSVKVAYGKSDGTFSNKNQGEIKLDSSNFSYENVQPTKGMFPCEKFLNGFGELCKKNLKEMNAKEDVPDAIVGNPQNTIQYFINKNHTGQLIPTPFFNSGAKNFYDDFTFADKPKSIGDDDENFKRIKDVKIYDAGGSSSVNRYKVTSDDNCGLTAVDGSKVDVSYPNSMLFTFIDYWKPIIADLNGDGVTDFALTYPRQPEANFGTGNNNPLNGTWKTVVAFNEADKSNKINAIHLGNDAEIKIKYSNTVELGAFDKDLSLSYPFVPYNVPICVVKSTESPNGIGGSNAVEYNYKNGVFNLVGRGFLGFETVTLKSTATNQTTVKNNLIDSTFLHYGLIPLKEITSFINGKVISNELYQNAVFPDPDYGSRIMFNYIDRKKVLTKDLDGNTINTNESIYSYDKFGNLVFSRTDYPNGQSESIINDYWETSETQKGNDFVVNWIIGRLSKTIVNKTLNPNPQINRTSEFDYDATTGQLTIEKILTGTQFQIDKEFTYDNRGNKIKEVAYPENNRTDIVTTEFTYSHNDYERFLVEKKDALGYTIKYTPDIVYGVNTEVYDNDGNKSSIGQINPKDGFDPFGRWKKSISPDGNYSYEETYKCKTCNVSNATFFKISGNSQSKVPQVVFYDVLDRPLETVTFDINYNKIIKTDTYDDKGRAIKTSLPYFEGTPVSEIKYSQFTYDDLGRIVKTVNPDNTENNISYNGLITTTENAKHQKSITQNDLLGRKILDIDNLNDTVRYKYDLDGNLAVVINQKGQTFQTDYDLDLGKQVRNFNPNIGHPITYTYNAWGEVEFIKSGVSGKNITELKYDKIGRTISRKETKYTYSSGVNAPENKIEDWVYWDYIGSSATESGKGKLRQIRVDGDDRKIDKTFQYDKYGRIIKKVFEFNNFDNMPYDATVKSLWNNVAKNGLEIGYTYNSLGQLDSIKYPKLKTLNYKQNFSVKYAYENGFTKTVTANGKKVWEYKEGYADGNAKSILLNNGNTNTIYDYDPTNQNLNRITTTINGAQVQDWQYNYDAIGNVTNRVDQINSPQFKESFEYDGLNRITKTTVANNSTFYRYDNLGNIIYKSDVGYYKYNDALNKLIIDKDSLNYAKEDEGLRGDLDDLEYYRDALGNRIIKEIKEERQFKIEYNHFNKPDNIFNYNTGASTNYFYDEDNNSQMELKQVENKNSCKFYVDGIFEFEVTEGFTVEQKFYITVNGSTFAYNSIQNLTKNDNILYLHKDALGSITAISDANGIVKDARGEKLIFAFDIWGQRLNLKTWKPTDKNGFTKGFTGHQHWDDLGLINMGGRIFDPVIGQFLQVDPILNLEMPSLGLTAYGYCYDNPLYYTDPTGYWFGSKFVSGVGNFFKDAGRGIVRGLILAPITGFNPLTFVISNMPGVSGFLDKNAGTIVAIEISVAMIAIGAPPVAAGFATGFGSSFTQTYLNGGSIGQSLEAGMISGTICGVTAGITQGIGTIFTGSETTAPLFGDNYLANQTGKAVTHAAFQGLMNEAQGGNFMDGALPALVSSASDGVVGKIGGSDVTSTIERTAIAGTLGGTASVLGGGKFANGAATACVVHLYNFEAHRALAIYMSGKGGTYNLTDEEFSSLKDDKSGVYVTGMCTNTGDKEIISFRGLTQNHYSVGNATFCVDNQGNKVGFYDCYNANPSTHRSTTGEFSTWVLSKIPGKAYVIQYNNCQPIVPRDCK